MIRSSSLTARVMVYWIVFFVGLSISPLIDGRASCQVIVFGDDIEYPPFSFVDDNGQPTGFNIELARAMGQVMGWDIEFQLQPWAETKESLEKGEIHVISGMFHSPNRAEEYAFSTRHSTASGDVFTRMGTRVRDIADLEGKRVAVQEGDIVYEYLKEQNLNIQFVPVPTSSDALRMVSSGEIDYAAVLRIPGYYAIEKYDLMNVRHNGLPIAAHDYSMAVRKDDSSLLVALNEGLQILKATGKYDEIYGQWLGVYEQPKFLVGLRQYLGLIAFLAGTTLVILGWAISLKQVVRIRTDDLALANETLMASQEDLQITNEELEATIQQLSAATAQLTVKYDQLRSVEEQLSEEKDLLRTTLLSVGDGVVVTDRFGTITMINAAAENLTGWTERDVIGRSFHEVFPGGNQGDSVLHQVMYGERVMEFEQLEIETRDGNTLIIASTIAPIQDPMGQVRGAVVVFRDVSEMVRHREQVEYLSYRDHLTGLYNRRFFEEELERLDVEENWPLAMIVADVNGLKLTNDAFGHSVGDQLLCKVAGVLKQTVGQNNIAARLGGDEFAVVMTNAGREKAERVVHEIKTRIEQQEVHSISISIAVGFEIKTSQKQSLQEVFNKAESRMYRNKLFYGPSYRGETVNLIINALYQKNEREEEHSNRVAQLCMAMGEALKMSEEEIRELETIGLLHDIGKITIDDSILNKEDVLTDDEWSDIKRHPELGFRILSAVKDMSRISEFVLSHHERYDGTGYPQGLKGDDIPLQSRIVAVVDAYDAMTNERPYREPLSSQSAAEELRKNAGTQFDPYLVEVFLTRVLPHIS